MDRAVAQGPELDPLCENVLPTLPPLPWLGSHSSQSNGAIIKVARVMGTNGAIRLRHPEKRRGTGSRSR
jgi:hypothetical protein